LKETEIDIQFLDLKNCAHGSSRTINKFTNKTKKGQKHESNIYMFFEDYQIAALKLVMGLVKDGGYKTSMMNLYKYNNVYFPEETFYNCN